MRMRSCFHARTDALCGIPTLTLKTNINSSFVPETGNSSPEGGSPGRLLCSRAAAVVVNPTRTTKAGLQVASSFHQLLLQSPAAPMRGSIRLLLIGGGCHPAITDSPRRLRDRISLSRVCRGRRDLYLNHRRLRLHLLIRTKRRSFQNSSCQIEESKSVHEASGTVFPPSRLRSPN